MYRYRYIWGLLLIFLQRIQINFNFKQFGLSKHVLLSSSALRVPPTARKQLVLQRERATGCGDVENRSASLGHGVFVCSRKQWKELLELINVFLPLRLAMWMWSALLLFLLNPCFPGGRAPAQSCRHTEERLVTGFMSGAGFILSFVCEILL